MSTTPVLAEPAAAAPPRRPGLARQLLRDRVALLSVIFLVGVLLAAILAPLIAPHDPGAQSLRDRLTPPVGFGGDLDHVLGTDALGRDVLSRLIFGARSSLLVGAVVIVVAGVVGTTLGILAGYLSGWVDVLVSRFGDLQIAFPGLLLALLVLTMLRPSVVSLTIVLAISQWMVFARMARSLVLSLRELPYVEAAEMAGCSRWRVIRRHLVPGLSSAVLTLSVVEFARVLLAEAGLSFLGLGVQDPSTSWGLEIALGRSYIFDSWWLVTLPGIALALTVLASNLTSSWLRVATDPREQDKRFTLASTEATA